MVVWGAVHSSSGACVGGHRDSHCDTKKTEYDTAVEAKGGIELSGAGRECRRSCVLAEACGQERTYARAVVCLQDQGKEAHTIADLLARAVT